MTRVLLETSAGQSLVAEEVVPEGHVKITPDCMDDDIDAGISASAQASSTLSSG
jgi:hypothetical protein